MRDAILLHCLNHTGEVRLIAFSKEAGKAHAMVKKGLLEMRGRYTHRHVRHHNYDQPDVYEWIQYYVFRITKAGETATIPVLTRIRLGL